jgi:hypothetical protein
MVEVAAGNLELATLVDDQDARIFQIRRRAITTLDTKISIII